MFKFWGDRDVDYFLWKYINSGQGSYVYLALDGSRVVSVICDMVTRIKLEDRMVLGSYTDHVATDPDYRGRGIYKTLQEISREDRNANQIHFNYHATQNPIISEHSRAVLFPFPLCRLIKIKDVKKYLVDTDRDNLSNWLGFNVLKSSNSLLMGSGASVRRSGLSVEDVAEFDGRFDAFWGEVSKHYNFILEKSRGYLNWRYRAYAPEEYSVKAAVARGELLGYIVMSHPENSLTDGVILDLLTLPGRMDVIDSLIDSCLRFFEDRGANSVYCQISSGHPLQLRLAKRGFIDVTRASKNLVYYLMDEPGFDPERFAKFYPKTVYFNYY